MITYVLNIILFKS